MKKLQKKDKIYVNRTLNMSSITSIGFDMDHTLALYNRVEFETLAFKETLKKFIEAGYPKALEHLAFDPKFVIRGLLVDRERGNLLKVDGHKYVKVAYHGHQKLEKSERHSLYNSKGFQADEFLSIDTFFALSEVQLFVEIVDYMRGNPGVISKSFSEVYADLREFIDLSHKDGSIKRQVQADIGRYISREPQLPQTLAKLIDGGKKLFLLTNSDWPYTDALMSYLLNGTHKDYPKWQDYFEYIIVGAGKPDFFTGRSPFYEVVESGLLRPHYGHLERSKIYHGGNARLFEKFTNQTGDRILYIGDHIYGDIMRSKELFNWRTMLVAEELDEQFEMMNKLKPEMADILDLIAKEEATVHEFYNINASLTHLKRKLRKSQKPQDEKQIELTKKLQEKEAELRQLSEEIRIKIEKKESCFHPIWGALLVSNLKKTRFAKQIEAYACIYTTRVTNFQYYSANQHFRSVRDVMPHDL